MLPPIIYVFFSFNVEFVARKRNYLSDRKTPRTVLESMGEGEREGEGKETIEVGPEEKLSELWAKEEKREREKRFDLILVRTYAETWRENHRGWISFLWI